MSAVIVLSLVLQSTCFLLIKGLFICEDGSTISKLKLCDGKKDCEDGLDETYKFCLNSLCPISKFRCLYGGCIKKEARCNGTKECYDGSDEKFCDSDTVCSNDDFQCFTGERCIKRNLVCDGKVDCDDGSDERSGLCEEQLVCPQNSFHCKQGGCIPNELLCDNFFDCPAGSDESQSICDYLDCPNRNNCTNKAKKTHAAIKCESINLVGVQATCTSEVLGYIPCNQTVPIGTVAKLQCQQYYESVNSKSNIKIQCQPDGTWSGAFLKCKPECGMLNPAAQALITHGKNNTNWPWYAVIHFLEDGEWVANCGGTLIAQNIVLTAAHCMWERDPKYIKVAFSKYHRDFNVTSKYTQIKDVQRMIMPYEYADFNSNYGSDIAVVFLEEPVTFTEYVKPACLDWKRTNIKHHLMAHQLGTIAGMGIDEYDKPSQSLQILDIPVENQNVCIEKHKPDFTKYITYTTFCAGWANGTGVCNGDSGGGLLFRDIYNKHRWILQGILSISPRRITSHLCDLSTTTIFTKVDLYLDWLQDIIN